MNIDHLLYERAQIAMAQLKSLALTLVAQNPESGLRQTDIGRMLGIHATPDGQQQGWVAGYLMQLLENEGLVERESQRAPWLLNSRYGVSEPQN